MRATHTLFAAALSVGLMTGPALADITAEDAIRIARDNGVATVMEVDRDDGKWEIEGRDGDGREIEVDIDATSGAVLKIERD